MSQIILNNLDPAVVEKLQALAQQHGRTLEAEATAILAQAIATPAPANPPADKRVAFHQALLDSEVVRQIKYPEFDRRTQYPLVQSQQIQGEPVSQTIIEERRITG